MASSCQAASAPASRVVWPVRLPGQPPRQPPDARVLMCVEEVHLVQRTLEIAAIFIVVSISLFRISLFIVVSPMRSLASSG